VLYVFVPFDIQQIQNKSLKKWQMINGFLF